MIPAFTSSSLNLPISVSICLLCSLGTKPASESLVALTRIMNRIVMSPFAFVELPLQSFGNAGNRHSCRHRSPPLALADHFGQIFRRANLNNGRLQARMLRHQLNGVV